MTSDHHFSKDDLERISMRVQSGQPVHFDPKQVEQFAAVTATEERRGKSVGVFIFGLVAAIIVVIVVAIYLLPIRKIRDEVRTSTKEEA